MVLVLVRVFALPLELEALRVKNIRIQFRVRDLLLAVAMSAVLAFNATLIDRICFSSSNGIRPAGNVGPVRLFGFTALACVAGPVIACASTLIIWHSVSTTSWPLLRGAKTGFCAGYLGWFFALILLCIAYGADGQAPLAALLLSVLGGVVNAILGALLACCWVWLTEARGLKGS
jgi:hypothetical protein